MLSFVFIKALLYLFISGGSVFGFRSVGNTVPRMSGDPGWGARCRLGVGLVESPPGPSDPGGCSPLSPLGALSPLD